LEADQSRKKALSLYCEALREAGLLVAVFAALDALFSAVKVFTWIETAWVLVGLVLLYVGVRIDPEVRR
jgi:hypothetical protein